MKNISKRFLSCLLALALLVTCGISGLVLPVAAAEYAEVGTNIAVNGDFETADGTQWTETASYTIEANVGFGGTAGLQMGAAKESTMYFKTPLTLRPSSTYEVTFLAKGYSVSFGSGGSSNLKDITIPGVSTMSNILSTTTSTDWVKYRVVFNTGEAPSVKTSYGFCFKRNSAAPDGSVTYIDNVEIRELSEAAKNESLAGGDFSGYWSEEFSEMFKAAGATTGYALETEGDNTYVKFPAAKAEAYLKSLDVQGSTKYRLSFKAKGGALGVYFSEDHTTTGGDWQVVTPR